MIDKHLIAAIHQGWLRDPLKGWAREDTALADPFMVHQSVVDVTTLGREFLQVLQTA